ncbi:hypothetical protein [Cellulomonas soli]
MAIATATGLIRWALWSNQFSAQITAQIPSLVAWWSVIASITETATVVGAVFIGGSFVLASLQPPAATEPRPLDPPTAPEPTEPDDDRPALGGQELQV